MKRQIFGISDSASLFVDQNQEPLFGKKMVEICGKLNPTICYIGAAKGDDKNRISEFQQLVERVEAKSKILSLFNPPTDNSEEFFVDVDIVYIDGGSTRNLLALLREWNVVDALHEAYLRGAILAGASAGLNILYQWSITDSIKSDLKPIEGLGILDGSVCVHHDSHPMRPTIFEKFLQQNHRGFPAFSLDDGVAVHFENEQIVDIFSLSEHANFNNFFLVKGQIACRPLEAVHISA